MSTENQEANSPPKRRLRDIGFIPEPHRAIHIRPEHKNEPDKEEPQVTNWALRLLSAPDLWRITKGENIKVAVLDTGVNVSHEDLKGAIKGTYNAIDDECPGDVTDKDGHGTHVAGIIAARDNDFGVIGIAPKADLYIAKVMEHTEFFSVCDLIKGIRWALQQGAHVISLSLAMTKKNNQLHGIIKDAAADGKFIICSAGNYGNTVDALSFPGRFEETIAVGAIRPNMRRASFSSTGRMLDVVAPGVKIRSTCKDGGYTYMEGTSMAAPFVAGLVALMLSKHKEYQEDSDTPVEDIFQLRQHLRKVCFDFGCDGRDFEYGFGLIDPLKLIG